MRKARTALLLGLALALAGGSAFAQVDFSKYVALGDSLTAGVVSNGSVADVPEATPSRRSSRGRPASRVSSSRW